MSPRMKGEGMKRKNNSPPHERWCYCWFILTDSVRNSNNLKCHISPAATVESFPSFLSRRFLLLRKLLCGMLSLVRREDAVTCSLSHSTAVITEVSQDFTTFLLLRCWWLYPPVTTAGHVYLMDVRRVGTQFLRSEHEFLHTHAHINRDR